MITFVYTSYSQATSAHAMLVLMTTLYNNSSNHFTVDQGTTTSTLDISSTHSNNNFNSNSSNSSARITPIRTTHTFWAVEAPRISSIWVRLGTTHCTTTVPPTTITTLPTTAMVCPRVRNRVPSVDRMRITTVATTCYSNNSITWAASL